MSAPVQPTALRRLGVDAPKSLVELNALQDRLRQEKVRIEDRLELVLEAMGVDIPHYFRELYHNRHKIPLRHE